MAATLARMSAGPPLPLPRPDAVVVAVGVELVEDAEAGGAVFVWGNAAWCWQPGDGAARRLAAVQLVGTGAAGQRQVGEAFGVNENTVLRWRQAYAAGGVEALAERRRGPRGPSKLTADKIAEIVAARAEGLSMEAIAARVGVSLNSVSRALKPPAGAPRAAEEREVEESEVAALEALARPAARTAERQAARAGLLDAAPPRVCQGAGLPLAGALTLLPALAVTGLVEVAERVYAAPRAAFYGLRALLLTLAFAGAVGAPRAEGLVRIDPVDLGRLLGLDRAPEVKTIRRRLAELAAAGRAAALIEGLAARHVEAHPAAVGVFYVDGHVRAYSGGAEVPKHHVARMRIAMPAEEDIWLADARGEGLLVWQADPGASLAGELRRVAGHVRELVGPDARPTICFDRGGWSPRLFAELDAAGFDILTYRKGVKTPEPVSAFATYTVVDAHGRTQIYELADRRVRIAYDAGRRRFACRQITRRSPNGHQTQILTTRRDADPVGIAFAMFSRWRQENFFRYLRQRYALDALDAYTTVPDDPDREVPNPARPAAKRHAAALAEAIDDAQADLDRHTAAGVPTSARDAHQGLAAELDNARAALAQRTAATKTTPARAPVSQVRPDSRRLEPERKRIHDAVRMATYNAESALARLLTRHYPRADDEARTLLAEIFTAPADLQILHDELHVTIHPLSAPRRTRALTGLCADLTATRTTYPGTDLTLVYTVKQH
jgi:transposase